MKNLLKPQLTGLLVALMLLGNPVHAGNYYQPNVFVEAMRTMLEIFLSMGSAGNNPYGNNLPGNAWLEKQPWSPSVTPFNTPDKPMLNGIWVSSTRFILVIYGGYARIAIDRDQFQDFYVRYKKGALQLREGQQGRVISFRMAQQNNRLALKDQEGRILLFRKIQ